MGTCMSAGGDVVGSSGGGGNGGGSPPTGVVVRREIREMSQAEQERYARAVLKMMENTNGPESSEYFRLAGYHGWPRDYCQHGFETFPGWHRMYLVDFELALREADRRNGNDGHIGLPYWDWQTESINGQFFPSVLRQFFNTLPADLVSTENQLKEVGYSSVHSDSQILRDARGANLNNAVWSTFEEEEHYRAASTRFPGSSVESPHNTIHVIIGFPMASVAYAAFHPVFFLHHCNVDRIYEKYIQLEPDSHAEFRQYQRRLQAQSGNRNRYEEALYPFKHPKTGSDAFPRDTFDISELGYAYDKLPRERPELMRERPTFAIFTPIEPLAVVNEAYELHVWVIKAEDESGWKAPENPDDYEKSKGYAGYGAIWGSKPMCTNCKERRPFDCRIDATHTLAKQGLRRSQCVIKYVCSTAGQVIPLPSAIPQPKFVGPYFESPMTEAIQKGMKGPDVLALQRYLAKFQYYHRALDGVFGDHTEKATQAFQKYLGLPQTGVCDTRTKEYIMRARSDVNSHAHGEKDKANYEKGQEIKVFLDHCPGYMSQDEVRSEVQTALDEWAAASKLTFRLVDERKEADIKVYWGERTADNLFHFDGKGGSLGEAKADHIELDEAEYWVMQGETPNPRKRSPFQFLPNFLHEMGHSLGLHHSDKPEDVMFPYYEAGRVKLSSGDIQRIKALYDAEATLQAGAPTLM